MTVGFFPSHVCVCVPPLSSLLPPFSLSPLCAPPLVSLLCAAAVVLCLQGLCAARSVGPRFPRVPFCFLSLSVPGWVPALGVKASTMNSS